ncbi:unnamed protein product [Trifolium pratense]|uniref:Uncharacterized protein n=1 Tax=Trifolium pratense TaxID=57577 RepID=A0ACB0M9S7_TRIPR|nr:unnamed protein product [Trifolium pratense]
MDLEIHSILYVGQIKDCTCWFCYSSSNLNSLDLETLCVGIESFHMHQVLKESAILRISGSVVLNIVEISINFKDGWHGSCLGDPGRAGFGGLIGRGDAT